MIRIFIAIGVAAFVAYLIIRLLWAYAAYKKPPTK